MIELFLNGLNVDIDDNIDISISYKSIDTSSPTAIKNSFSKSVILKGTKTNNEVFGNIFGLDRFQMEGSSLYGVEFDPRKRVDFVLVENSDILEKGYFCLDSISYNSSKIEYSITLYGLLGDFFYNLQTNEDGETKTLADLYYGFSKGNGATPKEDEIMTQEEESKNSIMLWNANSIFQGWENIMGRDSRVPTNDEVDFDAKNMRPVNWIVAAPSYNGLNDDFSNDVVLVNMVGDINLALSGVTYNGTSMRTTANQKLYNNDYMNGWVKIKAERDLVEWEAKDLRSSQQRPAIKTQLILNAISNPVNNGGYEVIWDEDILNSDYYKESYIIRDRINFSEVESKVSSIYITTIDNSISHTTTSKTNIPFNFYERGEYLSNYNTTALSNGFFQVVIQEEIQIPALPKSFKYALFNYTRTREAHYNLPDANIYGCIAYRLKATDIDRVGQEDATKYSPYYFVSEKMNADTAQLIADNNGITNFVPIKRVASIWQSDRANSYKWCDYTTEEESPVTLSVNAPNGARVQITLEKYLLFSDKFGEDVIGPIATDKKDSTIYLENGKSIGAHFAAYSFVVGNTEDEAAMGYESGLFDGLSSSKVQKMNLTKKTLFGNTETPFDYLVSFTKMFDLRYRMDSALKRVYIEPRYKYYIDEVKDITDKVDISNNIVVKPTTLQYKYYLYGFETPESYGQYLYSKKNNIGYGNYKYFTGYNFNSDVNNLFEDSVFKNTVPYILNSVYFRKKDGYPSATFTNTYEITAYSGSTVVSNTEKGLKYMEKESDSDARLCFFDKEDSNMGDISDAFVFYDGVRYLDTPMTLTDNLQIMNELNDGYCYIYSPSYSHGSKSYGNPRRGGSTEIVARTLTKIPYFSKYLTNKDYTYKASVDFIKPKNTFINDANNYGDGIDVFSRFWDGYLQDIYDKDSKSVELWLMFDEKPNTAMRKFYYFNGSIWVISEIIDYNPIGNKPVKCVLIKVKDKNNYLN